MANKEAEAEKPLIEKLDKDSVFPPVEPVGDKAHRLAKSSIAAVPYLGGALTELLESIVQSPAAARRDEWIRTASDYLQELVDKEVVTVDGLRNDERVVSAIIEITQSAIRTHDEGKLELLRNAVRNVATDKCGFDEVQQSVLINMASQMPPIYLKVLLYAANPSPGSARPTLLRDIPALGDEDMANLVWSELNRQGLVKQMDLAFGFQTGFGTDNCLTALGNKLKEFIS